MTQFTSGTQNNANHNPVGNERNIIQNGGNTRADGSRFYVHAPYNIGAHNPALSPDKLAEFMNSIPK